MSEPENKRPGPINPRPEVKPPPKEKITLRPRDAILNARKSEIIRTMRDAAEAGQPAELTWVEELAEIVGVDIRKR